MKNVNDRVLPEEHARLRGIPLGETIEMTSHGGFKDVSFLAIKLRDSLSVLLERIISPCVENSECDRLC